MSCEAIHCLQGTHSFDLRLDGPSKCPTPAQEMTGMKQNKNQHLVLNLVHADYMLRLSLLLFD